MVREIFTIAAKEFSRTPIAVYALALLAPSSAVALILMGGFAPAEIFRDPLAVAGVPAEQAYLGFFSNLGMVLWTAASSICLFVGYADINRLDERDRKFLLYFGTFTLILMIDDLYMIHENMRNSLPAASAYALVLSLIIFRFHDIIWRLDGFLFIISLILFGLSMIIDHLFEIILLFALLYEEFVQEKYSKNLIYLLEDAPKFLGICVWTTFGVRAAYLLRTQPGRGVANQRSTSGAPMA